jgi:hypothetical protein
VERTKDTKVLNDLAERSRVFVPDKTSLEIAEGQPGQFFRDVLNYPHFLYTIIALG